MAEEIVRTLKPAKVFDAGCAMGLLVEALRDRGVEAFGLDISEYAVSNVRRDMRSYCRLGSIADRIEGRYDVIMCVEVLEHLPEMEAKQAAVNLCAATDVILLSSSPAKLTEAPHTNVHPPIYWLQMFADLGFWPDVAFDADFVAPHAVLLRKGQRPSDSILHVFSELIRYKSAVHAERERARGLSDLADKERQLASGHFHQVQLAGESQRIQARLEALLGSPGWRLLEKYRAWLRHQQAFHPTIFRAIDGFAKLLLRTAGEKGAPGIPTASWQTHSRPS
jgi:hypothetical protein